MELKKDSRDFILEVKKLLDEDSTLTQAKIAASIGWNITAMSNVLAERRNIPFEIYDKFKKKYGLARTGSEVVVPNAMQAITERLISVQAVTNGNKRIIGEIYKAIVQQKGPLTAEEILTAVYSRELEELKDELRQE